ncbi:MAG TPA: hypothetical protein O0X40_00375 [Methanocorpusculum sp.]|nr:hypothetical protein [Methanocorpusculum sp.]
MRISGYLLDGLDFVISIGDATDRTDGVSRALSHFISSNSCLVCGAINDKDGDFCSVCGAPLFDSEEIMEGMSEYTQFSDKAYFLDCSFEMQESYREMAMNFIRQYEKAGMIPEFIPRYQRKYEATEPERFKISVIYYLPDGKTEVKPAINLDFGVDPDELGNYLLKKHFDRFDAAHRKFHGCGLSSFDFHKCRENYIESGKFHKKE